MVAVGQGTVGWFCCGECYLGEEGGDVEGHGRETT